MRTTITIDDEIFKQLKVRAAKEATTVSQLIEDSVRLAVRLRDKATEQPFELVTFGKGGHFAAAKAPRPFGLAKGEFVVPDEFDDPLPNDLLDAFEGK